jgi:fatty acid desaturase
MAAPPLPHDARRYLQVGVDWRDLTELTLTAKVKELLHPVPWLVASFVLAQAEMTIAALPCSFMFFLTALRLNHEAIHRNIGISHRANHGVLFVLSVLMLGSNHAVAFNHLRHHRHCMQPDDIEGACGRMGVWRVLAFGPIYPLLQHASALRETSGAEREFILAELTATAVWIIAALVVFDVAALKYHVVVTALAQCLTAFFAVWTTHHDCDPDGLYARTQRGSFKNRISYNMFYHLEHHLFPKVPVSQLGKLAERLDAKASHAGICPSYVF